MQYLEVRLATEDNRIIYKRDFDVKHVFQPLIETLANHLVEDGTLRHGDQFVALVIPSWAETPPSDSSWPRARDDLLQRGSWVTLELEEAPQSDEPITYFTIELRGVSRKLVYRQDFRTGMLTYFFSGIEAALVQAGVLQTGDRYRPQVYVRDDDQADFDREEVHPHTRDASELIEVASAAPLTTALERRSLTDYVVDQTIVTRPLAGTVVAADRTTIVITRSALEAIRVVARSAVDVEQGGMLVGQMYERPDGPGYLVEISDHILAKEARGTHVELRFSFQSWQSQMTELKERFPTKRIVGWYHTHLVKMRIYTDESRQSFRSTGLFFSQDDIFVHQQFFRDKWYVAMVLDPEGDALFLKWEGDELLTAANYHVIDG